MAQPFMLQNLCYTFAEFRSELAAIVCGEGVADPGSGALLVASTAAGDHSVTVAAGPAFISGDDDPPDQGMYLVRREAGEANKQIPAGSGANPRVDTIVYTVSDAQYGGTDEAYIDVVAGTPSASAALTDAGIAASAGAVPDNSIPLAWVLVPNTDTLTSTISGANIRDAREAYQICGTGSDEAWDQVTALSVNPTNIAPGASTTPVTATLGEPRSYHVFFACELGWLTTTPGASTAGTISFQVDGVTVANTRFGTDSSIVSQRYISAARYSPSAYIGQHTARIIISNDGGSADTLDLNDFSYQILAIPA